ncbi:MAG TPA: IPT/TIG domain-containing protein, partial [Candidatus Acidoferrales bacterium]|nr:IPT/TIG domain-containing protein [Candidatus Acidoferrales bacterium]
TAGTGYTVPANGSNTRQGMQYEIVSSTQSGINTSMSWNTGTVGAAGIFAAFKAPGPSITSLNPTSGTVGTTVIITGTGFGMSQGSSTVTFNGISAGTASSWTPTSLAVTVPAGATTGNVVVTVGGLGSNGVNFTVTPVGGAIIISPRVTDLTFTRTQQFTATAAVTWMVDGVAGGSAASGTITTIGLYTPPTSVGTHTVTAQGSSQSANATVYVTNYLGTYMRDVDTFRTGQNLSETTLAPANVNKAQFGKLFSYSIDGVSDASPLYVANVNIPGQGFHNVVYVATEHDSVYAFDADGLNPQPLWQVSFINPAAGITTVNPSQTGDTAPNMAEAGITGTPVIDPATGTIYLVAVTAETTNGTTTFVQRFHALDITTGAEKFGGPVIIQATVSGSGEGGSGGQVPFDALHENQRAALLLTNGIVYIAWGAHADVSPYHGWVMGYNASTLKQVMAYATTPNARQGGIWESGDGLTTDSTGRIYFVTGNGTFEPTLDANGFPNQQDYGDSIVAINPNGTVSDYFTPHDQSTMASSDLDLGSGGAMLLPDQPGAHTHEALAAGKNGTIYVVDRDNMGHFNSTNDSQIVQSLVTVFPGNTFQTGNFKAPVYFNGSVYWSADADNIEVFSLTNGLLSSTPTSQTASTFGYPGCTLQISANGSSNGILWAIERFGVGNQAAGTTAPGILHAFDPTNLGNEFYNSNQAAGARDDLNDGAAKWAAPLVANGKVFVASVGRLTGFGLLP